MVPYRRAFESFCGRFRAFRGFSERIKRATSQFRNPIETQFAGPREVAWCGIGEIEAQFVGCGEVPWCRIEERSKAAVDGFEVLTLLNIILKRST